MRDTIESLRRTFRKDGLTPTVIKEFRSLIHTYYEKEGRHFPWRETRDPYHILVSEVMLQQTQTSRVLAKYQAFLTAFPTPEALAGVAQREVLAAWQGLGYNRRALNLQRAARTIVEEYGGEVPDAVEEMVKLPGVGPDTAGAIAVLAFNQPVGYLETNIRAVYQYVFFPEATPRDKELRPIIEATLDREDPRRWYFGLYDYGAMLKREKKAGPVGRRQSRFEGSDRQVRGAVLRLLLERRELAETELARVLGEPNERVAKIIGQLRDEGFIEVRKGQVRLRE